MDPARRRHLRLKPAEGQLPLHLNVARDQKWSQWPEYKYLFNPTKAQYINNDNNMSLSYCSNR